MSWGHKTVYTDTLWGLLFRVGDRWADIFNARLNLALGQVSNWKKLHTNVHMCV